MLCQSRVPSASWSLAEAARTRFRWRWVAVPHKAFGDRACVGGARDKGGIDRKRKIDRYTRKNALSSRFLKTLPYLHLPARDTLRSLRCTANVRKAQCKLQRFQSRKSRRSCWWRSCRPRLGPDSSKREVCGHQTVKWEEEEGFGSVRRKTIKLLPQCNTYLSYVSVSWLQRYCLYYPKGVWMFLNEWSFEFVFINTICSLPISYFEI